MKSSVSEHSLLGTEKIQLVFTKSCKAKATKWPSVQSYSWQHPPATLPYHPSVWRFPSIPSWSNGKAASSSHTITIGCESAALILTFEKKITLLKLQQLSRLADLHVSTYGHGTDPEQQPPPSSENRSAKCFGPDPQHLYIRPLVPLWFCWSLLMLSIPLLSFIPIDCQVRFTYTAQTSLTNKVNFNRILPRRLGKSH